MSFLSDHAFIAPGLLQGHVVLAAQPDRVWHVGLFVNDRLLTALPADLPGEAGRDPAIPPGHGFGFTFNAAALKEPDVIRLEVLNTSHVIAEATWADLRQQQVPRPAQMAAQVWHQHGLTLMGQLEDGITDLPQYEILALEGERLVGRSRALRWQHVGAAQDPAGKAIVFDLLLDPALADGLPHRIHVETSTGQKLEGSPVEVLAWPDSLRAGLAAQQQGVSPAEARRLDMRLDRLAGASMTLEAYAALYPELEAPPQPGLPIGGPIGDDGHWYPIGADWVLCCHAALLPLPGFAARLLAALPKLPQAQAVFCDLALRQPDGTIQPLLLPAFDWERLLEQGHAALCFALPRAALEPSAPSLVAQLLAWLAPQGTPPARDRLWHLPHPGALGAAEALTDSLPGRTAALEAALARPGLLPQGSRLTVAPLRSGALFPALHLARPVADTAISVIVPTRNQAALLDTAITQLVAQNPGFDLDLLIIDNGSDSPDALALLNRLEDGGARILEYAGGFNFALMNTLAVEHARHRQICFMNNDVAFPWPGVLQELCSRLACPSVGAVGPLMLRASDIVQHGGVTLGPWRGALHAFEDRILGDPGYGDLLQAASEPGGLTAAMMLTRRDLFEAVGGFDTDRFAVNFNDVDYGLKLRAAGHRLVFTPHARIRHYESVSRGRELATPAASRLHRELANLRRIWRAALHNDPQYHPLFALDALPYRALSLSHRDPAPRCAATPPPVRLPGWA